MNKKLLIGLGVVAAAGVAYYLWKRNKDSKTETPLDKREAGVKLSDAIPAKDAKDALIKIKKPNITEGSLIKTAAPKTT